MTDCTGITWVDDNVYVSGYDRHGSGGEINILDSHGSHISVFFTKYWQQLVEKEKHVLIGAILCQAVKLL
jgi:hypothetical protein